MFDFVLFDLDGTLTRSGDGIKKSAAYAIARLGYAPLSDAQLDKFVGPPLLEMFMTLCGMDEPTALKAVGFYRERFESVGWRENAVYPGIAPLLRALRAAGKHVAIVTAKSDEGLELMRRSTAHLLAAALTDMYPGVKFGVGPAIENGFYYDIELPEGKYLIPGVVSHSTNVVEHPELVAQRIRQFADIVGDERVVASTDCGLGGRIYPSIAWAKLEALAEGARLASK